MENTIPISVLMPVYNGSRYLEEAIESILVQTFTAFEFIIINDGSTDDSKEKILRFIDKRIVFLDHNENKGITFSLNEGIDIAKGKYILRMDADDVSLPERLEKQFAFMEAHMDVGAAGCFYYLLQGVKHKKIIPFTESEVLRTILLFNACLCHPATIIRKELLTEHNLRYSVDYPHAEDYDLWIQLSKFSKLTNVQEILFKYRDHSQQVTKVHNPKQKDTASIIRSKYITELGFSFTENNFKIHTLVSSNQLLTSDSMLDEIEEWFLKLVSQNNILKSIEPKHFNFFIGKQWYDCCGNTNLGMKAYNRFFKSPLHLYLPLTVGTKLKLAGKCVIRRYKSF
jgi:glycosyltransferase involved in cell wall biosynthesis